ncbi:MAG: siderophore-interacting protein [Paracoccus aminovorans]|nr:siderophore-interacting protein [Paracoccus aminovorans]
MRTTPLPEFQSEALLPGQDFAPVEQLIRAEAAQHGLDLHTGHGRSIWCQVEQGEFGARKRGDGVLVFARAHRADALAAMQQAIGEHLAHHLPAAAAALRWPSAADAGRPPANFSLARLVSSRRISADFWRVRLEAPGLHRFAGDDSLHFRLVLPQPGDAAPEWPVLGGNGQVVWPCGARALHRPVYTTRAIDPGRCWLDLDIFDHAGGRAIAWARTATAGAPAGLLGPSGGGIPQAPRLVLAGDETAYPALARILEARAGSAEGDLFLLGARADYPFPAAPGIRRHHLPQGAAALCRRLRASPPDPGCFLWIATARSGIDSLKAVILGELHHHSGQTHLSAYWNDKD